jgi:hypothetical protein
VTATYGAAVTTLRHIWPPIIVLGLLLLMLVGFFFVGMFAGEYWCADRSPWWGPPEDPNSECSGLSWASDHPGEFPWTMPK